jgi:hypothetical protein
MIMRIYRVAKNSRLKFQSVIFIWLIPLLVVTHLTARAEPSSMTNLTQAESNATPVHLKVNAFAMTCIDQNSNCRAPEYLAAPTTEPKQKPPRPTPTPLLIPPPANPATTNSIIGMSVIMISVILFGLWINRRKITK